MIQVEKIDLLIDLKHTVIERSASQKTHVFVKFLTSILKDLCQTQNQISNLFAAYIQDYVDFILKKNSIGQNSLQNLLSEFITLLNALVPNGISLCNQEEYQKLIESNIHILQELYTIKNEVKQHLKRLLETPSFEIKFFYNTKYPFKKQIIQKLIHQELSILSEHDYAFNQAPDSISDHHNHFVITAEPIRKTDVPKDLQFIYYSSSKINVFRKLQFSNGFPYRTEISCLSQLPSTITFLKETTPNKPVLKIGYAFDNKKFSRLQNRGDVVSSHFPIEFIPIDLRLPLNRKIDGFVHRVFDLTKDKTNPFSSVIMHNFHKLAEQKDIKLFDSMDSMDIIQSREAFQCKIKEIFESKNFLDSQQTSYKFEVPKACQIDPKTTTSEEAMTLVKNQNMKFPLVVKTTDACLDKNCHQMSIVFNEQGLLEAETSHIFRNQNHILQEYINHDERIYKVYAIGDQLAIQQKQSLPNLSDKSISDNCINFHSQASFKDLPEFQQFIKGFETSEIDLEIIKTMWKKLGKELKLSLVGFDLIKETSTNVYYLIDINYFPGFKGFKDLRLILHSHFYSIVSNNLDI